MVPLNVHKKDTMGVPTVGSTERFSKKANQGLWLVEKPVELAWKKMRLKLSQTQETTPKIIKITKTLKGLKCNAEQMQKQIQ